MFADYFFILLFVIGFLGFALVLAFIIVGLIKKSAGLRRIGYILSIIPVICLGLSYWYYGLYLPKIKQENVVYFSGRYVLDSSFNNPRDVQQYSLILESDMTFHLDSTTVMDFQGNGTWNLEESLLSFSDFSGKVFGTAYGQGGHPRQIIFNHFEVNEIRFIRIQD